MPTSTKARPQRNKKSLASVLLLAPALLVAAALWLRGDEATRDGESRSTHSLRQALSTATSADIFDPRESRNNTIRMDEQAILRGPAVQHLARSLRVVGDEVASPEFENFYVCSFSRGDEEIGFAVLSRNRKDQNDWLHIRTGGKRQNFLLEPGALEEVAQIFKRNRGKPRRALQHSP
jgi:hypothetical protein